MSPAGTPHGAKGSDAVRVLLSAQSYACTRLCLAFSGLLAAYSGVVATVVVAKRQPSGNAGSLQEFNNMLHYAVVFLVIALISAVLGFGGIAAGAAGIAKILFGVFLVMAIVSFLFGLTRRR